MFIRQETIQKAAIQNCGQDMSGNSTYNCPRNRHKSTKTIEHKNNQHMNMKNDVAENEKNHHSLYCI